MLDVEGTQLNPFSIGRSCEMMTAFFRSRRGVAAWRRPALDLAMDVHVILTVVHLAEQKNYRLLIIVC